MLHCPNPFKYGALRKPSKTVFFTKFTAKPLGSPENRHFFTAKIMKKHLCVTLNRRFAYHFKKPKID